MSQFNLENITLYNQAKQDADTSSKVLIFR